MSNSVGYYLYQGVDTSLGSEGGQECNDYLSPARRLIETILFSCVAIMLSFYSFTKLKLPFNARYPPSLSSRQRALLTFHGICFGIELGFKFATQTLIFVLNPCHLLTVLQCILLAVPPSPIATAIYRVHLHWLNGPLIAILFPIVESRKLPLETAVYFIQHLFIILIPAILMKPDSPYSVEPLSDFSWAIFALSIQILYHFLFLQPLGLLTAVNMNTMICPGSSDPFAGPNYRIFAMIHQPLCILLLGKLYSLMTMKFKLNRFLRAKFNPSNVTDLIVVPEQASAMDLLKSHHQFPCSLITELTTSPFKSTQFSRFYYSAIPVSITRVQETYVSNNLTYEHLFCNQSILFIPVTPGTPINGTKKAS